MKYRIFILFVCANCALSMPNCSFTPNFIAASSQSGENVTGLCGLGDRCCVSTAEAERSESVRSWVNNTVKFSMFKQRIAKHLTFMSTRSDNSLWNDTTFAINAIQQWGSKYLDTEYNFKHSVFTCGNKILQAAHCGVCTQDKPVQACKTLCHNVVLGCVKAPLGEFIEVPWKHAVNSIIAAVRLIANNTTGHSAELQDLQSDLQSWREPLSWWVDGSGCDDLPDNNCWNGNHVGRYEGKYATWKSNNPEFNGKNSVNHQTHINIDAFHKELVSINKKLEKHWAVVGRVDESLVLALSSSEDLREGSGFEDDDDDDEDDMEYGSTGYGGHTIETDDEDLIAGSGSGEINNINDGLRPASVPPPSSSSSSSLSTAKHICFIIIIGLLF